MFLLNNRNLSLIVCFDEATIEAGVKLPHVIHMICIINFFAERIETGEREDIMQCHYGCARAEEEGIAGGCPKIKVNQYEGFVKGRCKAGEAKSMFDADLPHNFSFSTFTRSYQLTDSGGMVDQFFERRSSIIRGCFPFNGVMKEMFIMFGFRK